MVNCCHCHWEAHSHVATDMPERVARRSRLSEDQFSCNRTKDSAVVFLEEEPAGRQGSPLEGPSQEFRSFQVAWNGVFGQSHGWKLHRVQV